MLVVQFLGKLASRVDFTNSNVLLLGRWSPRCARWNNSIFSLLEASFHHFQGFSLAVRLIDRPRVEPVARNALMFLVDVSHAGEVISDVVVFQIRAGNSTNPTTTWWRTPVLVTELEHAVIPNISGTGSNGGCVEIRLILGYAGPHGGILVRVVMLEVQFPSKFATVVDLSSGCGGLSGRDSCRSSDCRSW